MKSKIANRLQLVFSSPRLTFALLVYGVALVFVATLAQREIGITAAQGTYFESFFAMGTLGGVKFPFVGGATVGALALVNIISSGVRFSRFGIGGFGFSLTHTALALLILSGALQYFMRIEGSLSLKTDTPTDLIYVKDSGAIKKLPFTVCLKKFEAQKWSGSDIARTYSSDVVFARGGSESAMKISMNSPASFGGWTFYQMSYGRDGSSVLSAVKNPARLLPWISIGGVFLGMMMIFLPRAFGGRSENEK